MIWRINEWFPDLDPKLEVTLKNYCEELLRVNQKINLISPNSVSTIDLIHVADCLKTVEILRPSLESSTEKLADFGSGNGFPGLVLAICLPSLQLELIESDQRKAEFLMHMIEHLSLQNVSVQIRRVEDLEDSSVQLAIARGFAPLSKALLNCRKVLGRGCLFYHMKGDSWASEVSSMPSQLYSYFTPSLVAQYDLPLSAGRRAVVVTEKLAD